MSHQGWDHRKRNGAEMLTCPGHSFGACSQTYCCPQIKGHGVHMQGPWISWQLKTSGARGAYWGSLQVYTRDVACARASECAARIGLYLRRQAIAKSCSSYGCVRKDIPRGRTCRKGKRSREPPEKRTWSARQVIFTTQARRSIPLGEDFVVRTDCLLIASPAARAYLFKSGGLQAAQAYLPSASNRPPKEFRPLDFLPVYRIHVTTCPTRNEGAYLLVITIVHVTREPCHEVLEFRFRSILSYVLFHMQ